MTDTPKPPSEGNPVFQATFVSSEKVAEAKKLLEPHWPGGLDFAALAVAAELQRLQERHEHASVCELAADNQNVMEYCKHWEGRAESAEAELAKAQERERELTLEVGRRKKLQWAAEAELEKLREAVRTIGNVAGGPVARWGGDKASYEQARRLLDSIAAMVQEALSSHLPPAPADTKEG